MSIRKLIAGNWKMHGLSSDLPEIGAIAEGARAYPGVDVAPYLSPLALVVGLVGLLPAVATPLPSTALSREVAA